MVRDQAHVQPVHEAVEKVRGAPLEGGVGTAVFAHAVHNVAAFGIAGQHFRDDPDVVLQIGVQADDAVRAPLAGRVHTGPDRVLVPGVGREADAPAEGIVPVAFFQQLPGAVAAAVVHIQGVAFRPDQALGLAALQQLRQGVQRARQGFFLIIAGNHQGQQGRGTGQHGKLL